MSKKVEQSQDLTEFDSVMSELDSFAKAYAGDDALGETKKKKKSMMTKDDGYEDGEGYDYDDDDEEGDGNEYADGEGYENPMMKKSVEAEQAIDAEEFLQKAHSMFSATVTKSARRQDKTATLLAKGLIAQGDMLKSLLGELAEVREEVSAIGGLPKMRKSKLSIHERKLSGSTVDPNAAKEGSEIPKALLAKAYGANGLIEAGILDPISVSIIQRYANSDQPLPANMGGLAKYATQTV